MSEDFSGHLLYGRPLDSFTKEELMRAIIVIERQHQERITGLREWIELERTFWQIPKQKGAA